MRIIFLIILMSFVSYISFAQTQSEMNEQSAKSLQQTELRMNSIYKKILKEYSDDTLFIKNLNLAQKAWHNYYLLEIQAMFPDYKTTYYGSMLSMCTTTYAKSLVESRIQQLMDWIKGSDDGDCASSIKSSDKIKK